MPAEVEPVAVAGGTFVWDGSLKSEGADTIVGLSGTPGTSRLWLPPQGVKDLARRLNPVPQELTHGQRAEAFRSVLAQVEHAMLAPNPPGTAQYNATHGLFNLLRTIADGMPKGDTDAR